MFGYINLMWRQISAKLLDLWSFETILWDFWGSICHRSKICNSYYNIKETTFPTDVENLGG